MPLPVEPALRTVHGGDLALSSEALANLARAVLARGAAFRFRARGYSMAPFIRDGDVVTLASLYRGLARVGEVVAFTYASAGKLAVHRVVARRKDRCLVQGDAIPEVDGWVPVNNILGRVIRVEREGHRVHSGMGPERPLIALLNRYRLRPYISPLGCLVKRWRAIAPPALVDDTRGGEEP